MSAPGRSQALKPEPFKGEGATVTAPGRSQALEPEPFKGEGATATAPGRSQALEPEPFKSEGLPVTERPEGFRRVAHALAQAGHPHPPLWLEVPARTSQEAADALGVTVGQIAKSVIFRRKSDNAAVLVVTSGDRRVDERRVAVHTGPLGRADAEFVKASTGFSIGGVAPLAHAGPVLTLIDRELFRFDEVWAAAGHPNGVFRLSPQALQQLTGAPVADVVQEAGA